MAQQGSTATVDSGDIVRLILQSLGAPLGGVGAEKAIRFCKENSLFRPVASGVSSEVRCRTLQCLQEESRVSLNAVDSLDALLSDINKGHATRFSRRSSLAGHWDAVLWLAKCLL